MVKAINFKDIKMAQGNAWPMGTSLQGSEVQFTLSVPEEGTITLVLIDRNDRTVSLEVAMNNFYVAGSLYSVLISGLAPNDICYTYNVNGRSFVDIYAEALCDAVHFGVYQTVEERSVYAIDGKVYDWEGDTPLCLQYHEMILYKLHVRGFTCHSSSKTRKKGTFAGIIDKISYLKELGVNAVELMPVVDFQEVCKKINVTLPPGIPMSMLQNGQGEDLRMLASMEGQQELSGWINYWGYGPAHYFAPKASYCYGDDPCLEFKEMVKNLHQNGIEVILELNFSEQTAQTVILDCLRFWVLKYHVDGFHININVAGIDILTGDPLLAGTKLLGNGFDVDRIYAGQTPGNRRLCSYQDDYQKMARRFLKGDEDCIRTMSGLLIRNDSRQSSVNYLVNNNGFTLIDLVSYDQKHNEDNGENNRDGTDYNNSWNCGVEGPTRKKKITELRKKQMKNAVILNIFHQGVPMIYAGDEFGHTQKGNNNAYCQDNDISWLDWTYIRKHSEHYEFYKVMLKLRREHPILHPQKPFRMMDYLNCGYPDLSFHGEKPWHPDQMPASRTLGVMYCGQYAQLNGQTDDSFYFAYNMHWEEHTFDLPALPKGQAWQLIVDTQATPQPDMTIGELQSFTAAPRSIGILKSVSAQQTGAKQAGVKYGKKA